MTKVYVMESCPDYVEVKQRYGRNPAFEKVRERGNIGIPCFIKEDGTVLISLKKFDDSFEPVYAEGAACNLDGTGC